MRIKESYEKVRQDLGAILDPVELVIGTLPEEEAFAMQYLYAFMPYSDIANNQVETYLDFVRHGVRLYEERGGTELPESRLPAIWLFHPGSTRKRSARADHSFIIRFRNRSGKSPLETVLEINYWCAGGGLYEAGMTAHYLRCPSGKEGTAVRRGVRLCGQCPKKRGYPGPSGLCAVLVPL